MPSTFPTLIKLLASAVAVCGMIVGLVLVARFNPATSHFYPQCPMFAATGLHCAGCGTLRALHQFLTGHPGLALRYNPLLVVLIPFIGHQLLYGHKRQPVWLPQVCLVVLVVYTVLRNIPVWPLELLAPPG